MIKFIKRNTIISVFGFISAAISISYAITYNMPDYFGIESWYSLFNNISISYIAALIFYILQIYKPECENHKRAQRILTPLFSDLIQFIEITIACCRKYVSTDKDNKITIDWWDKEQKVLYFTPISDSSNNHRPAIRKSADELKQLENIYKSKIKEIKERIDFRECDPNILIVLSKLESTDFFKLTINVAIQCEGSFFTFPNFQEQVNALEAIKDDLKSGLGITCRYDVRNPEDIEIAVCNAIFNKNALQATSTDEFGKIAYKELVRLQLKPFIEDETQLNTITDILLNFIKEKKDTN